MIGMSYGPRSLRDLDYSGKYAREDLGYNIEKTGFKPMFRQVFSPVELCALLQCRDSGVAFYIPYDHSPDTVLGSWTHHLGNTTYVGLWWMLEHEYTGAAAFIGPDRYAWIWCRTPDIGMTEDLKLNWISSKQIAQYYWPLLKKVERRIKPWMLKV